jgi:tRNA1(Val) A37 N6-methylase TrmN6
LGYEKTVARHEVLINLEEVVKISSSLLKSGGNLAMVHRTDRLLDVLFAFKKYNIEPKRIMFIYNKLSKGSTLFFIEGQKNGNVGLKIEKPFVVYNEDNSYAEEYSTITEEVLK